MASSLVRTAYKKCSGSGTVSITVLMGLYAPLRITGVLSQDVRKDTVVRVAMKVVQSAEKKVRRSGVNLES